MSMFESLSDRLGKIFDGLTGRGALSEADVDAALREVRRALLEADVSLEVVKAFVEQVRERAVGAEVTRSVTPGQQVIKIVHDELVKVLGETAGAARFRRRRRRSSILMVGLQGSGKTTTTAKIAKRLKERQGKKVLLASLDTRRPAAMEQLRVLGEQVGVDTLPIVTTETPVQIARRALQRGAARRLRRADPRYRRPHPYRRRADGRDGRDQGDRQSARNPARRRCADRPGRREPRALVRRARRHHRHRADPRRRRWPRRRGALDARRDRQADQADRHRRKARRARGLPPAAASPTASSAWATSSASSRRPPRPSTPKTRPRWPRSSRRAASTSRICAASCSR